MTSIVLQSCGAIDRAILRRLANSLSPRFGVPVEVRRGDLDASLAFDPARQQFCSTVLLKRLAEISRDGQARILGVTDYDLFVPVLTFVFGEAQLGGRCAIVSRFRLLEEVYGLPRNESLTDDRLVKEAVHELGHTFGLRHCDDWQCAMAASHSIERVDIRSADYCTRCGEVVFAAEFKRMRRLCSPGAL